MYEVADTESLERIDGLLRSVAGAGLVGLNAAGGERSFTKRQVWSTQGDGGK